MRKILLATLPPYQSKEIVWQQGSDSANFEPSFIPKLVNDVNGRPAVPIVDYLTLHFQFTVTTTVATLQGEDIVRFFRDVTLEKVDDTKHVSAIRPDSLRLVSYAHLGPDATHEHQDLAVGAGQTIKGTLTIPLSKPFMNSPEDNGLAAWSIKNIAIRMADVTYCSLGATVAITSGKYYLVAGCHEERSIKLRGGDVWLEQDFDTTDTGAILLGGRLQDLYLFIPGANGGQTLANLDTVMIDGVHKSSLYKDPTLKQNYARQRGEACNSFATKGSPLRSSPFIAADNGTLRAVAALLAGGGTKVWNGPELDRVMVRVTTTAALPATPRILARVQRAKTQRMKEFILDMFDVNASYIDAGDNRGSKRNHSAWGADQEKYMPEVFYRTGPNGQGAQQGLPRFKK